MNTRVLDTEDVLDVEDARAGRGGRGALILTGRIMTACSVSAVFCIKDEFVPRCLVSKRSLGATLALRFETVASSSPGPDRELGIKPPDGMKWAFCFWAISGPLIRVSGTRCCF